MIRRIMSYRQALPALPLRRWIAAYWSVEHGASSAAPRRVLPDGCADLVLSWLPGGMQAEWVGTMTRAIELAPAMPASRWLGVRFLPGGLYPWLGAPLQALADRRVALADLPARHWQPPVAALAEAGDFAVQCRLLDASLLQNQPRLPASLLLCWMAQAAPDLQQGCSVQALSRHSGVGVRTLQRRFADELGVSPQQHLRYLRFERALSLLRQGTLSQSALAQAAGYADQPHLVREFRRFAGVTPGRWR